MAVDCRARTYLYTWLSSSRWNYEGLVSLIAGVCIITNGWLTRYWVAQKMCAVSILISWRIMIMNIVSGFFLCFFLLLVISAKGVDTCQLLLTLLFRTIHVCKTWLYRKLKFLKKLKLIISLVPFISNLTRKKEIVFKFMIKCFCNRGFKKTKTWQVL